MSEPTPPYYGPPEYLETADDIDETPDAPVQSPLYQELDAIHLALADEAQAEKDERDDSGCLVPGCMVILFALAIGGLWWLIGGDL